MRRSRIAFAISVAAAALLAVPPAWAIGPGGWSRVGHGATTTTPSLTGGSAVTALNTDNPGVLYVGGNFTSAGNTDARRIAQWNGTSWSKVGGTSAASTLQEGQVFALAYKDGKVYAGGTIHNAGGDALVDFLAVLDITSAPPTWTSPCTSQQPGVAPFGGNVDSLQIIGNTLYVGGSFQDGARIDAADYLVACDLTTGVASPVVDSVGHAFSGPVYALTADSNGTLYAGGGFNNLEAIPAADHVARYLGEGVWQAMGSGPGPSTAAVDTFVRSLTASGTDVYVGTDAVNVAGIANADHVARWNGVAWSAVGSDTAGTNGWFSTATAYTIDALETYGSIVVAAGSFQNANGRVTADNIAYFDGSTWRPVGSNGAGDGPLNAHPTVLGVTGGKVYVGGNFTAAGGDTLARQVAMYALRLPDNSISTSNAGFTGNGVYSSTARGESLVDSIRRGSDDNVYIRIQNDGLVPASFIVKATGGVAGIVDTYFGGGVNVTAKVRAGTYNTGAIGPGASRLLRLHVHTKRTARDRTSFLIKSSSVAGTPPDAVRAKIVTFG